jgi:Xaa-Pro aminopeptidase
MNRFQLEAVRIATSILKKLTPRAGQSEKEVSRWIKSELKKQGSRPAFRIIVASGKRSARPHAFPTSRRIKPGELVVVDFGAVYNGYRSDITRTFVVGKPSARQEKIYQIVRKAQRKAISAARAGKPCREIDQAARGFIERKGFGKYFIHTTGHGIGRKVHTAPKISKNNRHRLKVGQVITIEPGIYIKGWGGVRIEDMILITEKGRKILT